MDPRITFSQLRCALKCPRRHYYEYIAGLRRDESAAALRIGSAIHLALELWGKDRNTDAAMTRAYEAYNEHRPPEDAPVEWHDEWEIERITIWNLLQGYFWRWEGYHNSMEILKTEQTFTMPILLPSGRRMRKYVLAGKIDGIVRLPDGRLAVMEHKTTGDDLATDSDYWTRLRIDQQISFYYLAARQMGYEIEAVLYDVIRKPTIRPCQVALTDEDGVKIVLDAGGNRVKTKDGKKWRESGDMAQGFVLQTRPETPNEYGERLITDIGNRPDFYYARREPGRDHLELDAAQADLYESVKIVDFSHKNHLIPRNANQCVGFGRCPYFSLCSTGHNPYSGEVPEGFHIVSDVHQELLPDEE